MSYLLLYFLRKVLRMNLDPPDPLAHDPLLETLFKNFLTVVLPIIGTPLFSSYNPIRLSLHLTTY